MMRSSLRLLLPLLLLLSACGDSASDTDAGASDAAALADTGSLADSGASTDTGAASPDDAAASLDDAAASLDDASTAVDAAAPDGGSANGAIVIVERVFGPSGRSYYVSLRREVPTAPLDRSMAREFSSADVEVFGGSIYIRSRTSNTMTRYSVSDTLELVEEETFSFALAGLGTGRVRNAYVSATQAYALDAVEWRLIEWNPTTMQLTGREIDVSSFARTDLDGFFGKPITAGGRVYAPVGWSDEDNLVLYPNMGVMLLDSSATPTLIEDERVGGGFLLYATPDGTVYAPGVVGGNYLRFGMASDGGALPPSGILRILPGASTFDPSYSVNVSQITGSPGVWAIHRIDATHVLAQLWDPATPIDTIATADDYISASNFIYVLINTETRTFETVTSIPRGGIGNSFDNVVDGTLYIQTSVSVAGGGSQSSVHRLTATGTVEAFTVPSGDLWHLERVR